MSENRIDRIDGEIDDLALWGVEYVRLERLTDKRFWLQFDDLRIYFIAETPISITDSRDN